jgi:effector-binding domain-containing protein
MKIETINKESEIAIAVKYDAVNFNSMASGECKTGGVVGEGYQKLMAYLAECGKQMAGVPYCKYTNGSADFMVFDIELGIPVSEVLPEKAEIYMSKTGEGKAVTAMHKGSYKEIEKTYTPMMQYLAENNMESTGVYYDYYMNNPADTPESELMTKVVFLVK